MGEECATIPLALHAAAYGWWVAGMVVVRRPGLIFLSVRLREWISLCLEAKKKEARQ